MLGTTYSTSNWGSLAELIALLKFLMVTVSSWLGQKWADWFLKRVFLHNHWEWLPLEFPAIGLKRSIYIQENCFERNHLSFCTCCHWIFGLICMPVSLFVVLLNAAGEILLAQTCQAVKSMFMRVYIHVHVVNQHPSHHTWLSCDRTSWMSSTSYNSYACMQKILHLSTWEASCQQGWFKQLHSEGVRFTVDLDDGRETTDTCMDLSMSSTTAISTRQWPCRCTAFAVAINGISASSVPKARSTAAQTG